MRIQILILGFKVLKIASVQPVSRTSNRHIREERRISDGSLAVELSRKIISWLNFLFLSSMCTSLLYSAEECDE